MTLDAAANTTAPAVQYAAIRFNRPASLSAVSVAIVHPICWRSGMTGSKSQPGSGRTLLARKRKRTAVKPANAASTATAIAAYLMPASDVRIRIGAALHFVLDRAEQLSKGNANPHVPLHRGN